MNNKQNVEFPFTTEIGDELFIKGTMEKTSYGDNFTLNSCEYSTGEPFDEDDFSDEDFENFTNFAEKFIEEDSLYRE